MIKLIVSDVDGTLTKGRSKITSTYNSVKSRVPKKNISSINSLDESLNFTIATGRSKTSLDKLFENAKINTKYKITLNGAIIYDEFDNIIYKNIIEKKLCNSLLNFLDKKKLLYYAFSSEIAFYGKKRTKNISSIMVRSILGIKLDKNIDAVDAMEKNPINKITIVFNKKTNLLNLQKQLQMLFPKLNIYISSSFTIDINNFDCDKGYAVNFIAKKLKAKINEIAVIGDSYNDLSMFSVSKYSYAIKHGDSILLDNSYKNVEYFYEAIEDIKKHA